MKSNIPFTEPEFGPGQEIDINVVLSVVDDFIRQNSKTSDTPQVKSVLVQPQLTGVYLLWRLNNLQAYFLLCRPLLLSEDDAMWLNVCEVSHMAKVLPA